MAAHPTSALAFVPKINPEDHGAKIVLCGALILTPITMMAALSVYNRFRSKTLSQIDGIVTLCGTVRVAMWSCTSHEHCADGNLTRY
jgi:hypothetical protein